MYKFLDKTYVDQKINGLILGCMPSPYYILRIRTYGRPHAETMTTHKNLFPD